jgi:hypothetical protein
MSDPGAGAPPAKRNYKILLIKSCSYFTSGVVVLFLALQLYDWFGPTSLPDCDDSGVQTTIRSIFSEKSKTEITDMAAFASATAPAGGLACSAELTFSDKSRGRLSYRVYLKGSHVMVVAENVEEL